MIAEGGNVLLDEAPLRVSAATREAGCSCDIIPRRGPDPGNRTGEWCEQHDKGFGFSQFCASIDRNKIPFELLAPERGVDLHLDPDHAVRRLDDQVDPVGSVANRADFCGDLIAAVQLILPRDRLSCGSKVLGQEPLRDLSSERCLPKTCKCRCVSNFVALKACNGPGIDEAPFAFGPFEGLPQFAQGAG